MNDDNLATLWQSQSTSSIDVAELQRRYRSQTSKQRFYALLDIASMVPLVYVWFAFNDSMDAFFSGFFLFMSLCAVATLSYLIWLRRVALQGRLKQTENYAQNLIAQLKNNQRIAKFTKVSTLAFFVLASIFLIIHGYMNPEKAKAALWLCAAYAVLGTIVAAWANKREKRFAEELANAKQLLKEDGAD